MAYHARKTKAWLGLGLMGTAWLAAAQTPAPVAPPPATASSVAASASSPAASPDARWVNGSAVNLRAEPSASASIVRTLSMNTPARLLDANAGGGYCRVALEGPAEVTGYTACRYLSAAPTSLAKLSTPVLDDGKPNPAFDPVKAFWVAPSLAGLLAYGNHLSDTRLRTDDSALLPLPRPPDAEFDRMKAHLARGIFGPKPAPYQDWEAVQRDAEGPGNMTHGPLMLLWGAAFDDGTTPGGSARPRNLVRAIALPAIRPSLFQRHTDLAPPGEDVHSLSGRFNIIHISRTRERKTKLDDTGLYGVWDVSHITSALARPVVRTTLYRDGSSRPARTNALTSGPAYGRFDEPPMCHDFVYGFGFGDIELPFGLEALSIEDRERVRNTPPAEKRLIQLVTPEPLRSPSKLLATQRIKLDVDKTGFISATQFHFDLNNDGVPDLAVWEGVGKGPGHLEGPTTTDDAYHRMAFVNIAGKWHLYTIDSYGYGCGC
jgi:hypothetical protein